MRIAKALASPGVEDKHIRATCPKCNEERSVAAAAIAEQDEDTIYNCRNGCGALVIVSPVRSGAAPWEGRGYRVGDHVIRNAVELRIRNSKMSADVLIPASPNALEGN